MMATQMSARERTLAMIVGVILAILLNFVLFRFFFGHRQRLTDELAQKRADLAALQVLFEEKEMWEARSAWLQAKQPKLVQEYVAGGQLLEHVKQFAQGKNVLLENPVIDTAVERPGYTSVSVRIETKSPWPALVAFLHELQNPEAFIAFENASIQKDAGDSTQMRGTLKIARWYAPK